MPKLWQFLPEHIKKQQKVRHPFKHKPACLIRNGWRLLKRKTFSARLSMKTIYKLLKCKTFGARAGTAGAGAFPFPYLFSLSFLFSFPFISICHN